MSAGGASAPLIVKICGISTAPALDAALRAGADWIGLVLHPRSPRFVADDAARALSDRARAGGARSVALLVDPDDDRLEAACAAIEPDMVQLHGRETPARVAAIRARIGRPVVKALGVAAPADLDALPALADSADHVLLDAKPPPGAAFPGGHGRAFDPELLRHVPPNRPVLLSGGLDPGGVAGAIRAARAAGASLSGVDVSSGVETAPGVKDAGLIAAFAAAVRAT